MNEPAGPTRMCRDLAASSRVPRLARVDADAADEATTELYDLDIEIVSTLVFKRLEVPSAPVVWFRLPFVIFYL